MDAIGALSALKSMNEVLRSQITRAETEGGNASFMESITSIAREGRIAIPVDQKAENLNFLREKFEMLDKQDVRGEEEEIKEFLSRIKKILDKKN